MSSSDNLSNVLGNIGNTDSNTNTAATSAAPTSGSSPASNSASATATQKSGSNSASATGSGSAPGSNTLTNAPQIGSSSSSSAVTSAATITGAPSLTTTLGNIPHLTGLPTLSGYYSYPPASVPPTAGAPYLDHTSLPENFVFIVVGAVIAFVAVLIITWRVVTSWSINRRFRRHEGTAGTISQKASYTQLSDFKQKPSGAYTPGTAHDMKDLGNLPRNFSSVPSLFFSPTAEVAQRNSSRPISRDPSGGQMHLPAGHYRDVSRN